MRLAGVLHEQRDSIKAGWLSFLALRSPTYTHERSVFNKIITRTFGITRRYSLTAGVGALMLGHLTWYLPMYAALRWADSMVSSAPVTPEEPRQTQHEPAPPASHLKVHPHHQYDPRGPAKIHDTSRPVGSPPESNATKSRIEAARFLVAHKTWFFTGTFLMGGLAHWTLLDARRKELPGFRPWMFPANIAFMVVTQISTVRALKTAKFLLVAEERADVRSEW
ncbi:Uu.00g129640.m01.CDS01 [Anthostomella pinea]|uniref:Uu.00g129640.m01.CDS01 n=1 Tax=Anthostomella pinea TaxID=933095 RepID=A0AAI8VIJ4_9PEZI|nr:Uu.00g129640.m01.CDS01 [Anthostomella pinea]